MFFRSAISCRVFHTASLCSALLLLPAQVFAQDMTLPGSADPGRALEQNKPAPRPMENLELETPKKRAVPIVPEGVDKLRFVLKDIKFQNMTAYPVSELEKFYKDYMGREISVATLFEIMAKVQQKYLDDGYALTKVVIPNQNIEGGHVVLDVIEGHVGEVELTGDLSQSYVIDDAARRIRAMRPLNVKKLERIMLILNDLPDLNVSAVLANPIRPEEQGRGSVRLILQENEEKEKTVTISVDNHGSVFTGPLQGKANARMFNIGPQYSELSVSGLTTAPIEEQKLGSANYSVPIFGASGAKMSVSLSRASTEPGSNLSTLDIKGASQNVAVEISYPIIRQRDKTLTIDGSFEWKNSRTKILGEELYDDRLRVAKIGGNYNFTDSWAGYSVLDIHFSQGLDVLGARETGSVGLSRQDGHSDFRKWEFLAGRLQALPRNFEIFALVNAQYAYDPLLSSEEFGFGGGQVGRGYDSSEITGDHGVSASIELRYRATVPAFKTVWALQPYAFYDIGKVWNIDEGAKDKFSAASAGVGLRLDIGNDWNMDFNLAKALTRSADNEPKYQNDLGARFLFSISRTF